MKVPSALAFTVAASELSGLYKRMVTGLLARTRPVITGAGKGVGVNVGRGVGVAVDTFPMVRLAPPVDGISTRILSPFETRALHSIITSPACKPLALNVNAVPPTVALFPLLPAIARMKLPFWGPLIAATGSAPNRFVTTMLLTSTRAGL